MVTVGEFTHTHTRAQISLLFVCSWLLNRSGALTAAVGWKQTQTFFWMQVNQVDTCVWGLCLNSLQVAKCTRTISLVFDESAVTKQAAPVRRPLHIEILFILFNFAVKKKKKIFTESSTEIG